jgi:hypothetical protein
MKYIAAATAMKLRAAGIANSGIRRPGILGINAITITIKLIKNERLLGQALCVAARQTKRCVKGWPLLSRA